MLCLTNRASRENSNFIQKGNDIMNNFLKNVQGWMLNGQMPTDKSEIQDWNGIKLNVTVRKYTFLKGLDFDNQIVIYDTSEMGAWNQLSKQLGGGII